ncbi:hypothetical protein TcWFU_006737 [Taenia crassiceps]|uniref:Uncharacterized protein n=1 Tax=Taenia crassiceps TaxID=6207 RepID=A0ABR4Q227_9CEST
MRAVYNRLCSSERAIKKMSTCACNTTLSQQNRTERREVLRVTDDNDEHTEFESAGEIPERVTTVTRTTQRSPLHLRNIVVKVPRFVINEAQLRYGNQTRSTDSVDGSASSDSTSGDRNRTVTVERTTAPTTTVEVQTDGGSRVLLSPTLRLVQERREYDSTNPEDHLATENTERSTRNNYVKVVSYQPVYSREQTYRIPEVQDTNFIRSGYTTYDDFATRAVSSSDIGRLARNLRSSYIIGYEPTLYKRCDFRMTSANTSRSSDLGSERVANFVERTAVADGLGNESHRKEDSSSNSSGSDGTLVERGTRQNTNDVVYLRKTRVPRNVLIPYTMEKRDVLLLRKFREPVEREIRVERPSTRTQYSLVRLRNTERSPRGSGSD